MDAGCLTLKLFFRTFLSLRCRRSSLAITEADEHGLTSASSLDRASQTGHRSDQLEMPTLPTELSVRVSKGNILGPLLFLSICKLSSGLSFGE